MSRSFRGRMSRFEARALMRRFDLRPRALSGEARAARSRRFFETMETLEDPIKYFIAAMKTELEHGSVGRKRRDTDVTGDRTLDTARIVAAHLHGVEHGEAPSKWRDFPSYYDWLWDSEKNGRF
jgi:hypothetical protein